jgi:hypothetical protein
VISSEIAMRLEQAFESLSGFVVPADFGRFRQHIDPEWIEEALCATGTASVRRRRLPAEQVMWLVMGMALLRNESIERVVAMLDLALPAAKGQTAAKSGMAKARKRLGQEPVAYLFAVTAERWATQSADRHRWRGLSLHGLDGTTQRVPDSPENWKAFGGQCGNGTRNGSAYPLVRLVAVMALRSHLLSALYFGEYAAGETSLCDEFWHELPDDSLTIADRNFLVANDLTQLARSGKNRHWLTRAKSTTRLRVIKRLGRNDMLVEITLSDATRRKNPSVPPVWIVRAIKYQRKGLAAVAPLRSQAKRDGPIVGSRTSSASSCAVRSSVSSGASRRYVSFSACSRAVITRRSMTVTPGRTSFAERRCSAASWNSSVGLSCSSARASSQSRSRAKSSSPGARKPRTTIASARWSVHVCSRGGARPQSLGAQHQGGPR